MNLTQLFQDKFQAVIKEARCEEGHLILEVNPGDLVAVLQFAKSNPLCPFDLLLDICGVDYLPENPRFAVVYHLYSLVHNERLRLKVRVEAKNPVVASVINLWPAADWFEREVFDMYGICFDGHPNLKRLLMWEEFEGHPLRKDYPIARRQPIPTSAKLI